MVRVLIAGDECPQTMTPEELDVGSRVHEYGGSAYWVADDDAMFVVNHPHQRVYRLADGGAQPRTRHLENQPPSGTRTCAPCPEAGWSACASGTNLKIR